MLILNALEKCTIIYWSFVLLTVWCYIGYLRQHKHYKYNTAPKNVVCWPHRKPTQRPGRKAPTLRPDPNTSGTGGGRVVKEKRDLVKTFYR